MEIMGEIVARFVYYFFPKHFASKNNVFLVTQLAWPALFDPNFGKQIRVRQLGFS